MPMPPRAGSAAGSNALAPPLAPAALALLPITPADSWKPDGSGHPTLQILGILLRCLGLPYFVLASTSPLLQRLVQSRSPDASPLPALCAVNVGSLLALVSFPFFLKRTFRARPSDDMGLGAGHLRWRPALIARSGVAEYRPSYTSGCRHGAKSKADKPKLPPEIRPSSWTAGLWLLPACASVLLLATTNKICQEVAVIRSFGYCRSHYTC